MLIWTFNEPFPNAAHGSIMDYYGSPRMAFYASRRSNAALVASLQYDNIWTHANAPLNATVWVDSESGLPWSGTLHVDFFRASGGALGSEEQSISVAPSEGLRLHPLAFVVPADAVNGTLLVRLRLLSTNDRAPAFDDVYAFGIVPPNVPESDVRAPLAELLRLPTTTLSVILGASGVVIITNTGAALAVFVKVTPRDASGSPVGFVAFQDNFVLLEPRESRHLAMTGPGVPHVASVSAEAWNSEPVAARAVAGQPAMAT